MHSRRLFRLTVAGATIAASLALAEPATAEPVATSVRYDPETKTGFVDRDDVRKAFGWTGAALASKAAGLAFDHEFWTDDTYAVTCGGPEFAVTHHLQYGRYELDDVVTNTKERGGSAYGGKLLGFRLTGARSGISGTSVAPGVGQPCPEERGTTIDSARRVSSMSGWALTVNSGDLRRELIKRVQPAGKQRT